MKRIQWKRIRTRVAYKNKWVTLLEDDIRMPDGSQDVYAYIDGATSILSVAIDERGRMLMVRHHRYPTNTNEWEFPGGGADGQQTLLAAKRELLEETGYVARSWKKIGTVNSWAFRTNEAIVVYGARGLSHKEIPKNDDEPIDAMEWFASDEIVRLILSGKIRNAQIISAFFYARHFLNEL